MKELVTFIKDMTFWVFVMIAFIMRMVYLFVVKYYMEIIGVILLYFVLKYVFKNRNQILSFLGKKIKNLNSKNREIAQVNSHISEIKSRGKLSRKEKDTLDLLEIKLQQLRK